MNVEKRLLIAIILSFSFYLFFSYLFKEKIDKKHTNSCKDPHEIAQKYMARYAPNFEITCLDGTKFRLSDYVGKKVIVINFFTTWATIYDEYVIDEIIQFAEWTEKKDVEFIAIDFGESKKKVKDFVYRNKINFRVAVDENEIISKKYSVDWRPVTVVIQPDGRIVFYETGGIRNINVSLIPTVDKYLKSLKNLDKNARKKYMEWLKKEEKKKEKKDGK